MKQRLHPSRTLLLGSLVFGLFFGAGNLIFPVQLGREAGQAVLPATLGFLLTAVGLPVLGVMASARAGASSLFTMTRPLSRRFALVFTCALYLTIGPLFAIPRTATVSFEIGVRPLVGDRPAWLVAFAAVFFVVTALVALRPGRLMDMIGRYLTPVFLLLLSLLVGAAFLVPMSATTAPPVAPYDGHALTAGLLDGYNTMDALAALAFAIVLVDATRRLGVTSPRRTAAELGKAGLVGGAAMAIVYSSLAYLGATSAGAVADADNGGVVLAGAAHHYFGAAGQYLIAAIVLVACLKTAIGLTAACAEMFDGLFGARTATVAEVGEVGAGDATQAHGGGRYRWWLLLFVVVSFAIATLGLETIIGISLPVLMFLYPLAIVVVLTGLAWEHVAHRLAVPRAVVAFTAAAAFFDLLAALPEGAAAHPTVQALTGFAERLLPGYAIGFGWVLPALVGLIVGIAIHVLLRRRDGVAPATTRSEGAARP
ncbi:branched-chain amino acid transport system II carrier protein [Mobilicoccus pelagius]|uniref:Putative branched-chain amino acid transport system carrier protein n=1 Tax=Mobilicoccus pelagius NBRC 104925 TaxID=1089455 RepID=H5URK5_9MICO|nr:branched-chain amino acid transport system II carrier protein [Mobilicoccus pelagius]GAB48363.1 putative branched-chain amino acid transport system carrier protein [Mobilicoccus pelagius NBRC 104925]